MTHADMEGQKTTKDRVDEYLVESGFPLEMWTAGVLRRGLRVAPQVGSVEQRVLYKDSQDGEVEKLRETDVSADVSKEINDDALWFTLRLIVECKSSTKQPWVLYRSLNRRRPRRDDPSALDPAWVRWRAVLEINALENVNNVRNLLDRELLDTRREFCSGIESANSRQRDGAKPNFARDAVRQVSSAAHALAQPYFVQPSFPDRASSIGVVVPVVVTDADLFAVIGSDDGTFSVQQTDRELLLSRFLSHRPACPVWVVNRRGFEALAKEYFELIDCVRFGQDP